jgi:uncharacterized protein (TIGR03032 family)
VTPSLRPVFLVATAGARADAAVLLESLALAAGVWTAQLGADVPAEQALLAELTHREGRNAADADGPVLAVVGGNAPPGRVPALLEAFPGARFVLMDAELQALGDDLAGLEPERRLHIDRDRLLFDPRAELQRVCSFLEISYDQALLTPLEAARRAQDPAAQGPVALGSVSTASLAPALAALGTSLVISTYQTGKLVCARAQADGVLNTHFRDFDKPMGIAVAPGRIALGTRNEVWDFRDMPEAAPKVEPAGTHDACFLPRNRHITGDIAVHDLAFAGGELWLVATAFSCLATLDAHHSFVPRWTPPFITALAPEDRCHLNGLAVVDDRVAYVTALGQTDAPGGWRADKATGGVLIDVASAEVVAGGLSMPHSPRWHEGRLWLLESGRGTLSAVDLAAGRAETVAELPGFTRGLAFAGDTAFVGLSQIRESSTFGDLPLTDRLRERQSGVWMVDLRSGATTGFLRFEDLVQEIFDVALLPGVRFPEIAEATGETTMQSYVLP